MLWIGKELGFLEQLSILSFLEHGHDITLFTTQAVTGIPAGLRVRDANDIFPCLHIVRDRKTGSPAMHADMFRYAMLAKTDLMWVDMDVLCIHPYRPSSAYVFGYEDASTINNAVLRLPPNSPALQQLLRYQPDTYGYPPFFSTERKIRYWLKNGGKTPHISRWPWGAIGPKGLTHHLRDSGEIQQAQAQNAFYAISASEITQLTRSGGLSRSALSTDVYYLHLWGKELRASMQTQALEIGSFLAEEKNRLATN
jgi:hypothetical protein